MQGLYLNALNNLNNVLSLKAIIEILQLKTDITECLLNCSNNGYCTYNASINSLVCSCFQNYTGSMCEIDKRPCNSARLQCANNGQCINNRIEPNKDDYNYTCNCSYPFYGSICHLKINICENMTCSKQGICKKVNDSTAVCKCFPGYSGDDCEISSTKIIIIKTVSNIAAGVSIAFLACFVALIVYIDIVRFLRYFNKVPETTPSTSTKSTRVKPPKVKATKVESLKMTTIAEEENEFGITRVV